MSDVNATEYVLRLVLEARDKMLPVLEKGAKEINSYRLAADGLNTTLGDVNEKITSMNTRAEAAGKKIGGLRDQVDELKKSVKEFITDEDDLEAVLERNAKHIRGQSDETDRKSESTSTLTGKIKDQIAAQKVLDEANVQARDKAVALKKEMQEGTTALNERKAALTELLKTGTGDDKIAATASITKNNQKIDRLKDDQAKAVAVNLNQQIADQLLANATAKEAFDSANASWGTASKRAQEFAASNRVATVTVDDETEAISKNTEAREANERAKAQAHRNRPRAGERTEPQRELDRERAGLRQRLDQAESQRRETRKRLMAERKFLGTEDNPEKISRIKNPNYQGDPQATARARKLITEYEQADAKVKRAKEYKDNFNPAGFLAKAQAAFDARQASESPVAEAEPEVVAPVVEEEIVKPKPASPKKPARKPRKTAAQKRAESDAADAARFAAEEAEEAASKAAEKRAQTEIERDVAAQAAADASKQQAEAVSKKAERTYAEEPPEDSDAYDDDDSWRNEDFSSLLDDDDVVAMAGGAGSKGGAGGRPRQTAKQKQTTKYRDLKKEYEGATRALLDYAMGLNKGTVSEEEWNIKREVTLSTLDRVAKGFAKLNSLGVIANQELKRVLSERARVIAQYDPIAERGIEDQRAKAALDMPANLEGEDVVKPRRNSFEEGAQQSTRPEDGEFSKQYEQFRENPGWVGDDVKSEAFSRYARDLSKIANSYGTASDQATHFAVSARDARQQARLFDNADKTRTEAESNLERIVDLHDAYKNILRDINSGDLATGEAVPKLERIGKEIDSLARKTKDDGAREDYFSLAMDPKELAADITRYTKAFDDARANEIKENKKSAEQESKDREREIKRGLEERGRNYERAEAEDRRRQAQQRLFGQDEADRIDRENAARDAVGPITQRGESVITPLIGKKKLDDNDIGELNDIGAALSRLSADLKKAAGGYDFASERGKSFTDSQRLVDSQLRDVNRRLNENEQSVRKAQAQYPGLIGKLTQLQGAIQRNSDGLSTLDNKIQGLLVLGILAFAEQLTSALISLAGSLGAVASSAISAGAALGGVLAAGAAQALPAIGLLIGAAARVKGVLDVLKQSDTVDEQMFTRANDAAKKQADTSDAVANAQDGLTAANEGLEAANDALAKSHEGVTDALDGVGEAQDKVVEAQKRLGEERKNALAQIRDLIQAERDAELAARGAALSQAQAQEALQRAVASGDSNAIQEAELRVLESDQDVVKADNNLNDAQDGKRKASLGVERQDNVVDARKGVRDAREGVVDAKDNVTDARKAVDDAEKGVVKAERAVAKAARGIEKARRGADAAGADSFTAAEKLQYMLAQLSPAERRLYESAKRLKETYKKEIGPITDILVDAFARGLDTANELLQDDRVTDSLRGLSKGLAGSLDEIREAFSAGPIVDQMARITDEGTKNLKPLTAIAINLGKAFLNIAEAAGPSLRRVLNYFKDVSADIRRTTGDTDKLEGYFDRATDSLLILFRAVGATIKLIAALVDAGQPVGDSIFEDYTKYVDGLAKSARENKGDVTKFFEDSKKGLYILLPLLPALAKSLGEVFNPDNMKPLVDFIIDTALPAIVTTMQTVGALTRLIFAFLDLPLVSDVTKWVIVALLLNKTFKATGGLVETMFGSLVQVSTIMDRITKGRFNSFLGNMAGALGGVIGKIPGLKRVGDALEGIGKKAKTSAAQQAAASKAAAAAGAAGGLPAGYGGVDNDIDVDANGDPVKRTRRQQVGRAAKGVGILGLVGGGAYASQQQGSKSLRDAAGIKSGDEKGAFGSQNNFGLGQVGGALGQLTSFDLGGFTGALKGMFKGSEPLTKFAKNFSADLDRLTKKRDVKGLQDLGAKARDLSTQYPRFADALKEAGDAADTNAGKTKTLNKRLEDTQDVARKLNRQGIKINIETRGSTPKALLDDLSYFLDALKKGIPTTLGQLRRDVASQVDRIRQAFVTEDGVRKDGFYEAMQKTTQANIDNLKRLKREGKITQEQYSRDMRGMRRSTELFGASLADAKDIGQDFGDRFKKTRRPVQRTIDGILEDLDKMPYEARRKAAAMAINVAHETDKGKPAADKAAKRLASAVGGRWRNMRDINVTRAGQMVSGTATAFNKAPGLVGGALSTLAETVNKALVGYGAKPVNAKVDAPKGGLLTLGKDQLARFLNDSNENDATGGVAGRGRPRYAAGTDGFIGKEGERGKDEVDVTVGRGEMILNAGHQRYIAPAVEAFYGHPLGKTFQRIRGFHRGGYADGFSGFAKGGYPNPGGLRGAGKGFDPMMRYLNSKFGPIYVMSGNRPGSIVSGSNRLSNHSGGNAVDITAPGIENKTQGNPPKGEVGARMDRLNAFIMRYIHPKIGLDHVWRAMTGGNHYNHIHQGVKPEYNKNVTKMRKFLGGLPDADGLDLGSGGGDDPGDKPAKVKAFKVTGRGAYRRLVQRALNQIQKGAQAKINAAWKKAADAAYSDDGSGSASPDATGSGDYPDGKLSEAQVKKIARQAMEMRGVKTMKGLWEKMLVRQAFRESGFDPGSANTSAAGKAAGNPKGLMQVVDGTYAANKYPGYNNPYNPLGSMLAAIKYIIGQYGKGNKDRAAQVMWNRGGGAYASGGIVAMLKGLLPAFAKGGEIEGTEGAPVPILAHAKEWVVNPGQQKKLARMLGMSRDVLKAAMGFSGNQRSAAGGVEIAASETATDREYSSRGEALRRKAARKGIYDLPLLDVIDSFEDALAEIRRATTSLKKSSSAWKARISGINSAVKEIQDETTDSEKAKIEELRKGKVTAKDRKEIAKIQSRMTDKEEREVKELRRERELLEKGIGKTAAQRKRSRLAARAEANRDEVYNTVNEISKEGGLFDQAEAQREKKSQARSRSRIFGRFAGMSAKGVLVAKDSPTREVDSANEALGDAATNLRDIEAERKLITDAMAKTKKRLAQLRKGGISAAESKEARKLTGQLGTLRDQFASIRDSEAEATNSYYEAQVAAQQAAVDAINKRAEKAATKTDIARRFATAMGREDLVSMVNNAQLDNLRKQARDLGPEIDKARRMGNTELADQLLDQANDINTSIFEGTMQAARDATDAVNKSFERRNRGIELQKRVQGALGNKGALLALDQATRQSTADQVGALAGQLRNAQAIGNTGLAQEIQDSIDDLNASMVEMTNNYLRSIADQINEAAGDKLERADYFSRAADVFGKLGLDGSAGGMSRRQSFGIRDNALNEQRGSLSNLLMEAMLSQPGNVGLIKELTKQIGDLDLTIQENTKAYFDSRVDEVNAKFSREDTIRSLREQIVQATGEVTGVTDNAKLLEYAQDRATSLTDQRGKLQELLTEATAKGNEEGMQTLNEQLLQNELALLGNTKTIRELTGATLAPQTYSSAYWREFQQAIYDGMGNVLPQYDVGLEGMSTSKIAMRSAGQTDPIIPEYAAAGNMGTTINEGDINTTINEAGRRDDTAFIATLAFAKKTIQR